MTIERRLTRVEKLLDAGARMLVEMQKENRAWQKENREAIRRSHQEFRRERAENRRAHQEFRVAIQALIEAQMRTDAKVNRLVDAMLRARSNGR